jgi:hypothetical protein
MAYMEHAHLLFSKENFLGGSADNINSNYYALIQAQTFCLFVLGSKAQFTTTVTMSYSTLMHINVLLTGRLLFKFQNSSCLLSYSRLKTSRVQTFKEVGCATVPNQSPRPKLKGELDFKYNDAPFQL